jgi:hypothetical protein
MTWSKIVLRIFGPNRLIALVKRSVHSRCQQDCSGLGLWSTNTSGLDLTSSSGLPGKTSKTPRLRRSNMKCFIHGDACQPSREPRLSLKLVEMKESLVKTLLRHIFGILPVIRYPLRHGEDFLLVTKNYFLESLSISALSRRQRAVDARSVSMIPNLSAISLHSARHWKRQSECQRLCEAKTAWKLVALREMHRFTRALATAVETETCSARWHSVYRTG